MTIYITLLATIITAFAAIFAPTITAIINTRKELRLKSLELFYKSKHDAYSELIHAASLCMLNNNKTNQVILYEAVSFALLMSSPGSRETLSLYASSVLEDSFDPKHFKSVIEVMNSELREYDILKRSKNKRY